MIMSLYFFLCVFHVHTRYKTVAHIKNVVLLTLSLQIFN